MGLQNTAPSDIRISFYPLTYGLGGDFLRLSVLHLTLFFDT